MAADHYTRLLVPDRRSGRCSVFGMAEDEDSRASGSPPRLVTVAEVAEILHISEETVRDWMARGLIAYESSPEGEECFRVLDEKRESGESFTSSSVLLDLYRGVSDENRATFAKELPNRQREHEQPPRPAVPDNPHARSFLEQLAEVMPAGYQTTIDGEILWLIKPDSGRAGSSSYWLTSEALGREEAVDCAIQSLHQIQQEIAEDTTEPWPAQTAAGYRGFPEPDGELVGEDLHLWFGDKTEPVLSFRPIDLGSVIEHG